MSNCCYNSYYQNSGDRNLGRTAKGIDEKAGSFRYLSNGDKNLIYKIDEAKEENFVIINNGDTQFSVKIIEGGAEKNHFIGKGDTLELKNVMIEEIYISTFIITNVCTKGCLCKAYYKVVEGSYALNSI